MTVKEFYDETGGDYAEVKWRLKSDLFVAKLLLKFKNDRNFYVLKSCMAVSDFESASLHSRVLRGVALNMAFKELADSLSVLSNALQEPDRSSLSPESASALFSAVENSYFRIIKNLDYLA